MGRVLANDDRAAGCSKISTDRGMLYMKARSVNLARMTAEMTAWLAAISCDRCSNGLLAVPLRVRTLLTALPPALVLAQPV